MQVNEQQQEFWIKILSRGRIIIPKHARYELGLEEKSSAQVIVAGDSLIIQSGEGVKRKDSS